MLIKTSGYRLYDIDKGEVSNLWMPVKGGLDRPTDSYVKSLAWLRPTGVYVLEPGQMAGGSGFSGGGGGSDTNNYVMTSVCDQGSTYAANTTYYFRNTNLLTTATSIPGQAVPVTSTLKGFSFAIGNSGSDGSAVGGEEISHTVRNVQAAADATAVTAHWNATPKLVTQSGLSVAYTAGTHSLLFKVVTASAWTTPATGTRVSAAAYFSVP